MKINNKLILIVLSMVAFLWLVYEESKTKLIINEDAANITSQTDSDADGVVDAKDHCPKVAGDITLYGCPDMDKDGLTDKEEEQKGTNPKEKDTDGDRVNDKEDNCPFVKGTKENKGCKKVEKVREEPEPVVTNGSENQLVVIQFNGEKYKAKKGFTTKTGLAFGSPGSMPFYRFEGGKLLKKEPDGTKWKEVTNQKDIAFFLNSKKIKKIAPSSNEKTNPSTPTGGSARESSPKADVKPTTKTLQPISSEDKKELYDFHEKIIKSDLYIYQTSILQTDLNEWKRIYKLYYSDNLNKTVKKNDQIEKWNQEILHMEIRD